jgi:hypothetical protein
MRVSIVLISSNLSGITGDGTVTFTLGQSQATLNINFVQAFPICGSAVCPSPLYLSFLAVEGQGIQQSQQLSITSDKNANWSASVSTDDGASWLSINPSNGQLDSNGIASASIMVNNTGLSLSAGLYQGTVTITVGSNSASSKVILVVEPS